MVSTPARVELILYEGVATISLNHPPLNIYDLEMRDSLIDALAGARDWPDLRAVVLRTSIEHFGVGADLSEFGSAAHSLESRRIRWDRDPWRLLRNMPVPVIACLRGYAFGSGFEMSLLCDLRIAAVDAVLGLPEINVGMLPAAGGTQSLTRRCGVPDAFDLVLSGRRIDAMTAHQLGAVDEVVDDPETRVGEICSRIVQLERSAVSEVLKTCRRNLDPIVVGSAAPLAVRRRPASLVVTPKGQI